MSGCQPTISVSLAPPGSSQNDGLAPIPSQSWLEPTPLNTIFPAQCAFTRSYTFPASNPIVIAFRDSLCLPPAPPQSPRIVRRNTKWSSWWTHGTKASTWSTSFTGRVGPTLTAPGSRFLTWEALWLPFVIFTLLILPLRTVFMAFPPLTFCSCSAMSGHHLLSLHLCHLIAWKSILRRGAVLHMLRLPWYSFSFSFSHHSLLLFS